MDMRTERDAGLIRRDDAVVIIIDMQEKLFPAMADKERLHDNVMRLVKFSKVLDLPVMITEQEKLGSTLREVKEELKEVGPISKLEFNCFGSESFTKRLEGLRRRSLILAGIEAHICVAQTALCAPSEYTVHVVGDAIAARSPHNHRVAVDIPE